MAKKCKAHTGGLMVLEGKQDFPCELPRGHKTEWHERKSPPLAAAWREIKGGREFAWVKTI